MSRFVRFSGTCALILGLVSFLFSRAESAQNPHLRPAVERILNSNHGWFLKEERNVTKPEFAPGQIIIKTKPAGSDTDLQDYFLPPDRIDGIGPLLQKYGIRRVSPLFPEVRTAIRTQLRYTKFGESIRSLNLAHVYLLQASQELDVLRAVADFRKLAGVEYAEPNYLYRVKAIPNDPYLTSQGTWGQAYADLWGLYKIKAPDAWELSTGAGIVVAVVDSGCDVRHPDLSENIRINAGEIPDNGIDDDGSGFVDDVNGWDFAYDNNDVQDVSGHGTHVAGTIAAAANNGIGIAGVAPHARIMVVKGIRDEGVGESDVLARSIAYAVRNGARVINMSWGGSGESQTITDAFILADSLSVTLVAAAGNNGREASSYFPANSRYVITAGASDHNDNRATFSNWNHSMDVIAPGGDSPDSSATQVFCNILSLRSSTMATTAENAMFILGNDYLRAYGTSMSAPHVSGLAALLLEKFPAATPEEVRQLIRRSADDVPGSQAFPGWDTMTGYGRINALNAVTSTAVGSARIYSPVPRTTTSDTVMPVTITAAARDFRQYVLEYGENDYPNRWYTLATSTSPLIKAHAADWDIESLPDGIYMLRLRVLNQKNEEFQDRTSITLDRAIISAPSYDAAFRPGQPIVISGTAAGGEFARYDIRYQSAAEKDWHSDGITLAKSGAEKIRSGILGTWNTANISSTGFFRVRLTIKRTNLADVVQESRIILDPTLQPGWPQNIGAPVTTSGGSTMGYVQNLVASDLDNDGQVEIPVAYGDEVRVYLSDGSLGPGWPQKIDQVTAGALIQRSPVVGDIDGDGKKEIFATNLSAETYAWNYAGNLLSGFPNISGHTLAMADVNHDGKDERFVLSDVGYSLRDSSGKNLPGWPVSITRPSSPDSPVGVAIGDADGDGNDEIAVYYTENRALKLHFLGYDGSSRPGWPVTISANDFSFLAPVLCDLDGDLRLEILVAALGGTVAAFRDDGSPVPGWPIRPTGLAGISGLSVGDVTGDGVPEIYVGGRSSNTYADVFILFDKNGSPIPGWPVQSERVHTTFGPGCGAFADIDGDGLNELIVGAGSVEWPSPDPTLKDWGMPLSLHAFHASGQEVPGFPKPTSNIDTFVGNSPAVSDFDADGQLEIAWLDNSGDLYMWRTPSASKVGSSDWPMSQHDPGRAGLSIHPAQKLITLAAGGSATAETFGGTGPTQVGYASGSLEAGSIPYGTAIFSLSQNDVVISEAAVPSSAPTTLARIFIDYRRGVTPPGNPAVGPVDINTGLALVNTGVATANVILTLRNSAGAVIASGQGKLAAGAHTARFVHQLREIAPDFSLPTGFDKSVQFGSLDIAGDQPLSVVALRLTINQRNETLLTSAPSADLTRAPSRASVYFPQFVDGGGYVTTIALLNTSSTDESGRIILRDNSGAPMAIRPVGGNPGSAFSYAIPPHGLFMFQSDGSSAGAVAGSAQILPDEGSLSPVGAGIFGFTQGGVEVTESGIPAGTPTTHARIFIDTSKGHDTGVALATSGSNGTTITFRALHKDGKTRVSPTDATVALKPGEHLAAFVRQLVPNIPDGFEGVLDLSASEPFVALTLRSLINRRGDFLLTTFPIADFARVAPAIPVFPQIAAGGGYQTEFLLLSAGGETRMNLNFLSESGKPLRVGK